MQTIQIIDSHTGAEPTRLVLQGGPELGKGSMADRLSNFKQNFDAFRRGVVCEPRGSDVIVGALLCTPFDPSCSLGVIFFNNTGYLGMCGHGTIGLIASLAYKGMLQIGVHRIDTPVGVVQTTLHEDGSVTVVNVPAYRYKKAVEINVPGLGVMVGDVAWGGNWFFLVNNYPAPLQFKNVAELTHHAENVRIALVAAGVTGANGAEIDHIEFFSASDTPGCDSRNFVLCPGLAYDRSPCGTGTSAKLACLAADDKLAEGALWHQESIVGSMFDGSYQRIDAEKVQPSIRGRAYVMAEATLLIDPQDPFRWGIAA
ncbi:4-hydroxyproline epimerase [Solimicrobium silvestre]|uniref:Proline racemase n=1 Tax=Solimicrobium silvestre TaxID=2099400 RepID=A0A2S9GXM9_9BURK|nr:4-hydroxyproline epimerase [Solimicrobium silvestre]PRC92474.1 Proline racemase [Solimicrobium silvestre]